MSITDLEKRLFEISYKHKLSHIGSCLTALPIIWEIYQKKNPDEKFVLSSGHAGLALYIVLEAMGGRNAEDIFDHHGVHPDRCHDCDIAVSAGSLGQGLPIAVGIALSNRLRNVYCLTSDGEWAEGSMWEALAIKDKYNINNLKIYLNANGYGAYDPIHIGQLGRKLANWNGDVKIYKTNVDRYPYLKGQDAHYYTMTKEDYEKI